MHGVRSSLAGLLVPWLVGCAGHSGNFEPAAPVAVTIPAPSPTPAPVASAQTLTATPVPETAEAAEPEPEDEAAPPESPTAMTSSNNGAAPMPMAPPSHGWLGVELEPAGTGEAGARVVRVVPTSPAEKAGLQAGDLIERLDNDAVAAPADVIAHVGGLASGMQVGVMLKRANAERLVAVTLGAAPSRDDLLRMSFVGRPAPQFTQLTVASGTAAPSVGRERGHVMVLEFWAPFCPGCRAMIPHMNQLSAKYGARGLRVYGITLEPVPKAVTAAAELGIRFPVVSDESGATTRTYQARAIPMVFAIDRKGNVRDVMLGFDPARLPAFDQLVDRMIAER